MHFSPQIYTNATILSRAGLPSPRTRIDVVDTDAADKRKPILAREFVVSLMRDHDDVDRVGFQNLCEGLVG
ncbi:hypothetical protein V3M54_01145 [Trueperella pyogenes]|uniref:hypothetical protein n=1 Tax=Trueperella pyogenes TaxID=1661 RepID=UPI00345C9753